MPRVDASVLPWPRSRGRIHAADVEPVSLCPEVKTGRLVAYSIDAGLSREVALRRIAQTMCRSSFIHRIWRDATRSDQNLPAATEGNLAAQSHEPGMFARQQETTYSKAGVAGSNPAGGTNFHSSKVVISRPPQSGPPVIHRLLGGPTSGDCAEMVAFTWASL